MKYKIIYTIIILLVFTHSLCFGQSTNNIHPLDTGQKMPDVVLHNVINYNQDHIRLSDLKGKLVILDLWGTGCTACIASFPHIDQLQNKFGNKIQFIMVNRESKDSTRHFFSLRPKIKLPKVPFVTEDSILSAYFPHRTVPEHIWIDKSGVVRAITDPNNATSKNIQKVLEGQHIEFRIKRDVFGFKSEMPIMAQNNEPFLNKMKYSSSLFSSIDGVIGYSSSKEKGAENPYHIRYNGMSARLLFVFAFEENGKYDFWGAKNSVILDVRDNDKFVRPKDPQKYNYWATHYSYCYDLWVPPDQANRIYDIMKNDLENYFNAYGKIEQRKIDCFVLVRTTKNDKLHSKGGNPERAFRKAPYDSLYYFRNWYFKYFVSILHRLFDNQRLATPFVDATEYKGKVDIAIPASLFDKGFNMDLLRKSLMKYGLDIKKERRKVNVLIISNIHP